MYKTTQQQKATAEKERRIRKPNQKKGFTKTKRKQRKKGGLYKQFFCFLQRPPNTKFHKPPLVSLRLQIEGDRERDGAREKEGLSFLGGMSIIPQTTPPFHISPAHRPSPTLERAQRRQRTKTATVAQYILHIVNTHRERSRHERRFDSQ